MMSTINGGHYQTISTSVSAGTPDAYDECAGLMLADESVLWRGQGGWWDTRSMCRYTGESAFIVVVDDAGRPV